MRGLDISLREYATSTLGSVVVATILVALAFTIAGTLIIGVVVVRHKTSSEYAIFSL